MIIKNIFIDEVDSTQLFAKKNYESFDPLNITCITAKQQTKGFGRYNRHWLSPKDMCLASTFYFRLNSNAKDLTSLAEIICISLAKVLINQGLAPKIRWPNDIMLNEKKLSGVLCQTIFEKNFVHLFLGIGININMDEKTAKEIDQPATSLLIETSKKWDINIFLKRFQDQFLEDFFLFLKDGFSPFHQMFYDLLLYKQKEITIFDGKDRFIGIIDSVTSSGELKLKLKSGEVKIFQTGDISL
jgi:BirA family transcriptional regulator, biotin operon repressor / biotin---[acetyl-CoA-carboxylase] ligase